MHMYIYARRRRNLAILRIMTINFFYIFTSFIFYIFTSFGFYIFTSFVFYILTSFGFYIFTSLRLYIFTSLHLYIFTSFELFELFELLYSSFFPSEFPSLIVDCPSHALFLSLTPRFPNDLPHCTM